MHVRPAGKAVIGQHRLTSPILPHSAASGGIAHTLLALHQLQYMTFGVCVRETLRSKLSLVQATAHSEGADDEARGPVPCHVSQELSCCGIHDANMQL
jgi:hypothetical protein